MIFDEQYATPDLILVDYRETGQNEPKRTPKGKKIKNIKKTAPDITHWGSWVPSGVRGTCNIAYNVSIKTLQCGFSIACNIHEEFII